MKIEVYSPTIRRKEMDAVLTAMVEDRIGPGEGARLLLSTAKEYLHFDYAISLRSPAIALKLALKALNPEKGQCVAISALSPRYYLTVLEEMDLCPLYCDVSASYPCISRETLDQALAKKPADKSVLCIVLHHTLGFVPDTASIAESGIPVISDISQSYMPEADAEDKNKSKPQPQDDKVVTLNPKPPTLASGTFTILGLEERDMLTAGGGALLFASQRRDSAALRNYGDLAPEYCLPDINAAMAIVQFKEARKNIEKRRIIAQAYTQAGLRTRHQRFILPDDFEYNNFAFPIVLEAGLKDVFAYARKKEILLETAFENTIIGRMADNSINCPVSYSLSLRTVLFPLYPRLKAAEAERVSKLIVTLP